MLCFSTTSGGAESRPNAFGVEAILYKHERVLVKRRTNTFMAYVDFESLWENLVSCILLFNLLDLGVREVSRAKMSKVVLVKIVGNGWLSSGNASLFIGSFILALRLLVALGLPNNIPILG